MLPILLATAALASQDVTLKTPDGKSIHALADKVAGAKSGVVLVHMDGRSAADWGTLQEKIARSDLAVVAPDLRGHGKSGSTPPAEADYPAMIAEVNSAVAWLRAQGVTDVSCVGAELGANLCLQAAAADPGIVNVIALSPSFNVHGVTSGDALKAYGDRPLLLVASSEDTSAARAATTLEKVATGQKHIEMLTDAGHGTQMLNRDASLEGLMLSWLLGTYTLASGDIVRPKPEGAGPGIVETTGKKLPSHQ